MLSLLDHCHVPLLTSHTDGNFAANAFLPFPSVRRGAARIVRDVAMRWATCAKRRFGRCSRRSQRESCANGFNPTCNVENVLYVWEQVFSVVDQSTTQNKIISNGQFAIGQKPSYFLGGYSELKSLTGMVGKWPGFSAASVRVPVVVALLHPFASLLNSTKLWSPAISHKSAYPPVLGYERLLVLSKLMASCCITW